MLYLWFYLRVESDCETWFYRDSRNAYTVKEVRFLQPNIAIAFVHSRLLSRVGGAVDQAGREFAADVNRSMSEAQARQTLVFSQAKGKWEIVAFQNTKVAEGLTAATV
jgi:hypothetical protein